MVITHHGACLCVAGGERCHFSCCLINERLEEREIKSCGRHDALGKAITVIGEIAGEDGSKMETAAAFGRKVDNACGNRRCQRIDDVGGKSVGRLDKTGDDGEIHLTPLGECLHRVKDSGVRGVGHEDINGDTASSMYDNARRREGGES